MTQPKSPIGLADQMLKLAQERYEKIEANREEILTAFVAKYGFDPDHAMQITGRTDNGQESWHVIHFTKHQMERARDMYLTSMVSKDLKLTWWQKFCLRLAGVKSL